MNKFMIRLVFIFVVFQMYPLMAEFENSIELRGAALYHSSGRFREIYGSTSGNCQIEFGYRFCCYGLELEEWTNVDWFFNRGRTENFKEHTHVNMASVSSGLKIPYRFCKKFMAYLGIGPSFARIWLKNDFHHGYEKISKFTVGVAVKSGVCYSFTPSLFLDVFVDYVYQPVHFNTHIDAGGVKIGGGLGYRF